MCHVFEKAWKINKPKYYDQSNKNMDNNGKITMAVLPPRTVENIGGLDHLR